MMVIVAYVLFGLVPAYAAILYYLGLASARIFGARESRAPSDEPQFRFTLVIPAHNEEVLIGAAVESCNAVDYPDTMKRVVVVADRCSDGTAAISAERGAEVWERGPEHAAGKGMALAWAFQKLFAESSGAAHEAFLVLDADCTIEPATLRVTDAFLREGIEVIQTNHRVSNPDVSAISYAAGVGRILEYDLCFAPKSKLGLSVMLVGTGMVFNRKLLERYPWNADSTAEDTEYTLQLADAGIRVRFASNAAIDFAGAESHEALHVQRKRWAEGNLNLSKRRAVGLLLKGLIRGDLVQFDLGWSLLTASRPLVLLHASIVMLLGLFVWAVYRTPGAKAVCLTALMLIPLYGVYFLIGILWLGVTTTRIKYLLGAPRIIFRLIGISAAALFRGESDTWVRTPRE